MPPRIWNRRRQWLGNLIPVGLAIMVGTLLAPTGFVPQAIGAVLAAWLGINHWGFYENAKIDQELRDRTGANGELIGFVYKIPPTALDAHAEIGLVAVHEKSVEIVTEHGGAILSKEDVKKITRRANIHSLLGLGGWIVLRLDDGAEVKLESRQKNTMLASKFRTNSLYVELRNWQK